MTGVYLLKAGRGMVEGVDVLGLELMSFGRENDYDGVAV
jgi:hypothetical protein